MLPAPVGGRSGWFAAGSQSEGESIRQWKPTGGRGNDYHTPGGGPRAQLQIQQGGGATITNLQGWGPRPSCKSRGRSSSSMLLCRPGSAATHDSSTGNLVDEHYIRMLGGPGRLLRHEREAYPQAWGPMLVWIDETTF